MNPMISWLQSPAAERLGWVLVHSLWQLALLAGVYVGVWQLLRRSTAAARYLAACAIMVCMVLVLPLTAWLVQVQPSIPIIATERTVDGTPTMVPAPVSPPAGDIFLTAVEPPRTAVPASTEPVVLSTSVDWKERLDALFTRALPWIVAVWMVGVFALAVRQLGGWILLRRLCGTGNEPVDEVLAGRLRTIAERLGVQRAVRLFSSVNVAVPSVIGHLKPVILLPASLISGLSTQQIEAILAHELAHVRRHDYLVNLIQVTCETVLFYHPAVWWISREIRREREHCCDDLAVQVCGDRIAYARTLATLEEHRFTMPNAAMAATGGSLLHRIRRIVGPPAAQQTPHGTWLVGMFVLAFCIVIPLVMNGAGREDRARAETNLTPAQPDTAWDEPANGTNSAAAQSQPTADTLEQWLADKEVVEVRFAGPHMDLAKLRELLAGRSSNDVMANSDYILIPGEGGGANRAFVTVQMQVNPENIQRVLALQKELAQSGFDLDPSASRLWSFKSDIAQRGKAWELVSQVLPALESSIKQALPQAQTSVKSPPPSGANSSISYEVPGTQIRGMVHINEIKPFKPWELPAVPGLTVHLPHIGLIINAYYQVGGRSGASPERTALLKAVRQAIRPLVELEESPIVWERPATPERTSWSQPVNGLQCRLLPASQTAAPSTGKPQDVSVYVTYELRNVGNKAVKYLPWYSPLEGVLSGGVFHVVNPEGNSVAYLGKNVQRPAPTAESFVMIAPGQTVTNRVGLPYDFSKPGSYWVTSTKTETSPSTLQHYYGNDAAKVAQNPDNIWTGTLESNEVEVKIVPARESRNERSGQAPAAASDARQRLMQSVAIIQGVYENTRDTGRGLRRQVWEIGEALPWRSTLQPSCLRQGGFHLEKLPEPWPVVSDAPALRSLLADPVPAVRALAAEALATLQQPEDLPRLAALLSDSAEATAEVELNALPGAQLATRTLAPDWIMRLTWHKSSVASHAAWGLNVMLGDCCPETIMDLQFTRLGAYGSESSSSLPQVDPSILASLAAGDPKDHLWYWQEYIHRSLHQWDGAAEGRTAKTEWMESFNAEMRTWPAERRAMVRLLASDIHQGGADMAYYDTPGQLLFGGPLELGLPKSRVLELLDGVKVWPDERRDRGGPNQVMERLAMGWSECFDSGDVPRLLARFANARDDLWWSGRAALLVALAHLMPASGTASDDPANAEGFLRQTLRQDNEVFVRSRAASELMRLGLDVHWPLLSERFFEDRANDDTVPKGMLEWLKKATPGNGPTRRLVELAADERFRPLWFEPEKPAGKAMLGGGLRRQLAWALNSRVGRTVVTDEDLAALKDSEQGPARLQLVLARVREIGEEDLGSEVIPQKRTVRLGDPIVVSLRVTNQTSKVVSVMQSATVFDCFEVIGPDGKRLPYIGFDGQAFAYPIDVAPFSLVTLAEALDLTSKYLFQKPGRYSVRFSDWVTGLADSPRITIEVTPGTLSKFDEVVASLLPVCPDGWWLRNGGGVIPPSAQSRASGFDLHLCHNHMRGEAVWLWFTTGQTPGDGAEYLGRVGELSVYGSVGTNTPALWPTAVQDISRALQIQPATPPKSSQNQSRTGAAAMAAGDSKTDVGSTTDSIEKDIQVVPAPAHKFSIYQVLGHTNAPHFRSSDRARIIFSDAGDGANRFDAMRPQDYPLEGLILAEQPLLTEADLIGYDYQQNLMRLKPGASLGRSLKPSVWGVPFVVVADGQRLFLGAFWTGASSYSANMPTISLDHWIFSGLQTIGLRSLPLDALRLENRQVLREGESPSDPRKDARLFRALEAAGKLMPTPATLEQWLEGKEVVEVCFAGPTMDQAKLRELLAGRGSNDVMVDPTYILLSGVDGEVRVQMQATPGNVKRLLSLQEELAKHGFTLDTRATQMWSYAGDAGRRRQAREMVPRVISAAAAAIRKVLPQASTIFERERPVMYMAGVSYEVPGTKIRGMIRINEIKPDKSWRLSVAPNLTAHLPSLGLMVNFYHRPGEVGGMDEVTPEHVAVLDAVRQAIQPLVQLEESPILRTWPEAEARLAEFAPPKPLPLATSLPQAVQIQRDRLLAEADARIRNGIRQLAATYPQLKKGQTWERLSTASAPGRIGIYHVQQPGKTEPDPAVFPPAERFNVLVVVESPPDEIGQMITYPLYPRLGLVGQVNVGATDPALETALTKLVNAALAPLAELEARATMQSSGVRSNSIAADPALAGSDSHERFLAVERFARMPKDEQTAQMSDFYSHLPTRSLSMFVEGILSSAPHDILNRNRAVYDGNTRLWAQQLADAASTLTPEQVATNLAGRTWQDVATRARALWVFEQHPNITSNLIAADLSSRDTNAIERAATVILALELKAFTPRLLEIWLANDERSQPFALWNALLLLRDPSIVQPLLDRVEKDPKTLVRCAGIFQGTLYNQPVEPVLFRLLDSPDPEIRYSAAYALEECTDARLAQPAARLVKEPDSRSRFVAAHMVARLPEPAFQSVRAELLPLLNDKDEQVRYYALLSFGKRKDPAAGPVILEALRRDKMTGQCDVWVMQALSALSGSTWNYYAHEWGPARPGNQTAIEKFEAWLKEHSPTQPGGTNESKVAPWPFSEVYRGLTPLSEEGAKERAIRECEKRLGTTNNAAIAVLPAEGQMDYFRVVVAGSRDGTLVTNSVLIHRFNAKGDTLAK